MSTLAQKHADYKFDDIDAQIVYHILTGNFDKISSFGDNAVEHLIERFFVTTHPKETEKIIDSLISIGSPALSRLEDISEYLSVMASPYYAKRINWTIEQIKKQHKKGVLK
jgi:hypothetical protein